VTSGLERPNALDHAEPRVLDDLISDRTVGDVEPGDTTEAGVIVVSKRAFVTLVKSFDHRPIIGCLDLLHRSAP